MNYSSNSRHCRCRGISCIAALWFLVFAGVGGAFLYSSYRGTEGAQQPEIATTAQPVAANSTAMTAARTKHIEDVKAGDRVWAYDTSTGTWAAKTVTRPLVHNYAGDLVTIVVGDQTIRATGNHPFWVVRGERLFERPQAKDVFPADRAFAVASGYGRWIEARRLEAGDVLVLHDGAPTPISAVFVSATRQKVYNLQVADLHTYAVSALGVVVHNKCFPAGTRVLMGNGSTKPIEEIRVGDQVMAGDPLSTGPPVPHEVVGLIRDFTASLVRVTIAVPSGGQSEIKPTPYHPFWTRNRGWVEARSLRRGDLLEDGKGDAIPVRGVATLHTGLVRTYNLTVSDVHTYFVLAADGTHLWVHNGLSLPNDGAINLGGEGEVPGVINVQGPWATSPNWRTSGNPLSPVPPGSSLANLGAAGAKVQVIDSFSNLPYGDGSINTVYTNSVPIDSVSPYTGEPYPQSSEIWRVLDPDGTWYHDGVPQVRPLSGGP